MHHTVHRLPYIRVAPVEVGLLHVEGVQVVLPPLFVPLPSATPAEVTLPVVRRPAAGRRFPPDVPVPFGVIPRRARLHEPGMLVRGVVGYEIDDHPDTAPVRPVEQGVEV